MSRIAYSPDFSAPTTPTLVIAGDHDQSMLATRGPDRFTDVYRYGPGAEGLLTVFGAEHSLGGIHAYDAKDTTDESAGRVALVRRAAWAYLRSALGVDDTAWKQAQTELAGTTNLIGRVDTK